MFSRFRNRKQASAPRRQVTRSMALRATPRTLPVIERSERDDGGLALTIEVVQTGWRRRFGGDRVKRTFVLDELGRDVYESANGERTVQDLITQFAGTHHVSVAEAEQAVSTYLKTLTAKGLIALVFTDIDTESSAG